MRFFLVLSTPLVAVIGFWLFNSVQGPIGNLWEQGRPSILLVIGRLMGLLAAYGIMIQILAVARVRWIEQVFGFDRLTRFHRLLGPPIFSFIIAHIILLIFSVSEKMEMSWYSQSVDFFKNWGHVDLAYWGVGLFVVGLIPSIPWVRRRIPYEVWYFFHLLLYVGIGLTIFHQFSIGGDFTLNQTFEYFWAGLYIFVGAHLVYFRFWLIIRNYFRHRFFVEDIVPETFDVNSIYITGKKLEKFQFKPGQFIIVRFCCTGFWQEAHPFSLSQTPNGKHLRISVKNLGSFSGRLGKLKKGTAVFVDGPHGVFTEKKAFNNKVLFIAGGIGITPFRPLIEVLMNKGKDICLLYAIRNREGFVFENELKDLATKGNFRMIPILSDEPSWPGEKGFVDKEKIIRLVPDAAQRDIFVCGPPPMMKGVIGTLRSMDVRSSQIHYENFAF